MKHVVFSQTGWCLAKLNHMSSIFGHNTVHVSTVTLSLLSARFQYRNNSVAFNTCALIMSTKFTCVHVCMHV